MPNEIFNYDNINAVCIGQRQIIDDDATGYFAVRKDNTFISLGNARDYNPAVRNIIAGWKFHISIDDHDQANMGLGWSLIKDILINHRVVTTKVVQAGLHMDDEPSPEERGKQITIYAFHNPNISPPEWQVILTEITQALVANNVQPSYRPPSDHGIEGSHYISYRNDSANLQGTKESKNKSSYNPLNFKDPYLDIAVIGIANQPIIPEWPPAHHPGLHLGMG